jgi:hypothetical protein
MANVLEHILLLVAALASKCMARSHIGLILAGSEDMAEMVVVPRGAVATDTAEHHAVTVLMGFGLGRVSDQVFPAEKALSTVP